MQIIAHRGLTDKNPGNSMAAFEAAIKEGFTALELDIQVCKTGEVVVFHNQKVDGETNGSGKITKMTLDEIKALELEGGGKIPTLDEVCKMVAGRATIFLDPKSIEINGHGLKGTLDTINRAVEKHGFSYDQLPIVGQNHPFLFAAKRQNRSIEVGTSFYAVSQNIHPRLQKVYSRFLIPQAKRIGASIFNPNHMDLTPELVKEAQKAGLKVSAWVVNEPKDIKRAIESGIDYIITDKPRDVARMLKVHPQLQPQNKAAGGQGR